MVRYLLLDGVTEGRAAEVMRWPIGHIEDVWRTLQREGKRSWVELAKQNIKRRSANAARLEQLWGARREG